MIEGKEELAFLTVILFLLLWKLNATDVENLLMILNTGLTECIIIAFSHCILTIWPAFRKHTTFLLFLLNYFTTSSILFAFIFIQAAAVQLTEVGSLLECYAHIISMCPKYIIYKWIFSSYIYVEINTIKYTD